MSIVTLKYLFFIKKIVFMVNNIWYYPLYIGRLVWKERLDLEGFWI